MYPKKWGYDQNPQGWDHIKSGNDMGVKIPPLLLKAIPLTIYKYRKRKQKQSLFTHRFTLYIRIENCLHEIQLNDEW